MKKLIAAMMLLGTVFGTPLANASIGGEVPGPDLCEYPMVGTEGMEGLLVAGVYDQACSGPTEINGSHWQTFYGGAASTTALSAGIGIAFLSVGISASAPTGVLRGVQYWACPDFTVADEPNPVMTWQGSSSQTAPVIRSACKTIHPKPAFLSAPPPDAPPQPGQQPFMPAPPPGVWNPPAPQDNTPNMPQNPPPNVLPNTP